ncbi:hypothetical protein TREES_T100015892 [Tupaia chinensis]|uniref:Uncharacterized protein n=1 Tax=Tupaia chinensis TaxID=246437 RepID=L9KX10_TUPCH|nr:hypothetical protein TREES_T100015892 [Tupaia chinensis]
MGACERKAHNERRNSGKEEQDSKRPGKALEVLHDAAVTTEAAAGPCPLSFSLFYLSLFCRFNAVEPKCSHMRSRPRLGWRGFIRAIVSAPTGNVTWHLIMCLFPFSPASMSTPADLLLNNRTAPGPESGSQGRVQHEAPALALHSQGRVQQAAHLTVTWSNFQVGRPGDTPKAENCSSKGVRRSRAEGGAGPYGKLRGLQRDSERLALPQGGAVPVCRQSSPSTFRKEPQPCAMPASPAPAIPEAPPDCALAIDVGLGRPRPETHVCPACCFFGPRALEPGQTGPERSRQDALPGPRSENPAHDGGTARERRDQRCPALSRTTPGRLRLRPRGGCSEPPAFYMKPAGAPGGGHLDSSDAHSRTYRRPRCWAQATFPTASEPRGLGCSHMA